MPSLAPAHRSVLLALLLLPSVAHAQLGGRRGGFWGDVGGGLGAGWATFRAGGGWTAAAGGWFGKYDDSFAIGRRVDLGLRVRQDVVVERPVEGSAVPWLRTAALLEARRSIDLLVVALRFGGDVGLVVPQVGDATVGLGGTVRANGAVGWRFVPKAALMLRVEAGVDVVRQAHADLRVSATLGVTVGLEVALPGRRREASATTSSG